MAIILVILEVIGKPLKEIKQNPKWGFKLAERDGMLCFQVETPSGPRLIPQELVVAAFMRDMKLRVTSFLNAGIKDVDVSTSFELTEPQKEIFKTAASKINLKISVFVVNNVQKFHADMFELY